MSELLNKVSNSVNRSNAIAKKHNVILNKTKLPTTTENQIRSVFDAFVCKSTYFVSKATGNILAVV